MWFYEIVSYKFVKSGYPVVKLDLVFYGLGYFFFFFLYWNAAPMDWLRWVASLIEQDPSNKNVINCDDKLKSILLGKPQVELAELPALIKMHFPKEPKWLRWYNKDACYLGKCSVPQDEILNLFPLYFCLFLHIVTSYV